MGETDEDGDGDDGDDDNDGDGGDGGDINAQFQHLIGHFLGGDWSKTDRNPY